MADYVTTALDDGIAIVTLDNPPVNALSLHLRQPLFAAIAAARDDDAVKGIVIACAGRTFVSGADISEFGTDRTMASPSLPELCAQLEAIDKPTVAAIHGTALGGGLELALACHYRVADRSAKVGLPEVKLGILPGAGGTVRLPRVAGPEKAVRMIVSGSPIGAAEALSSGIVDEIAEGELTAAAIAFAKRKVAEGGPHLPVRARDDKLQATRADPAAFEAAVKEATARTRGLEAPLACAEAVRNAVALSFDEALDREGKLFARLVSGVQSQAQRHVFCAARAAAKVPSVGKEVKPREIRKVGIIGAGTMGGGIAMAFANGGYSVTVLEADEAALTRGFATIEKNYSISVKRGSLSEEDKEKRLSRLSRTTDYADLADADLIIEAVFEEISVKRQVFGKLDEIAKQGAILATNTSYLDVNEIASFTSRPQDVVGLHFFSPANVMKLLEIVRGEKTAPDVLATALAVGRKIGKVPVVVGVCHGFVGNRMLGARGDDLEPLLLEGATPEQIDRVFTDFGFVMGPFAMWDLAGLDIGWRSRKAQGKTAVIGDALCEQGRFGQKTGKGMYLYEDGSRTPKPDPEVARLIADKAAELGIERHAISDEEIVERTLYPMVNEGARILEEKIAARPSDIDIVWVNGYGFPVGKGGPMFWADLEGLARIVERLDHWHARTAKKVFEPAASLRRLADTGGGFSGRTA
jgi:3-hydroxyacyl-CoA dehydrogenase